jgi:hypothetical protein
MKSGSLRAAIIIALGRRRNKYLAQINKSRPEGDATKKRMAMMPSSYEPG